MQQDFLSRPEVGDATPYGVVLSAQPMRNNPEILVVTFGHPVSTNPRAVWLPEHLWAYLENALPDFEVPEGQEGWLLTDCEAAALYCVAQMDSDQWIQFRDRILPTFRSRVNEAKWMPFLVGYLESKLQAAGMLKEAS